MSIVASTFFLVFLKLAILFDKIFLEDNLHVILIAYGVLCASFAFGNGPIDSLLSASKISCSNSGVKPFSVRPSKLEWNGAGFDYAAEKHSHGGWSIEANIFEDLVRCFFELGINTDLHSFGHGVVW